jgi:hypothetical protein
MAKIFPHQLEEVLFSSSDSRISKQLSKLEKDGRIRKIAPRTYTSNLQEEPAQIVKRNLFNILGHLFPGALLSHRSALEFQPTPSRHIFLTYSYHRKVKLPGLTVHLLKGPGPTEGDHPFWGEIQVSQRERALLENLQSTRKQGPDSKCLPRVRIEEKLEEIIRVHGEEGLNRLRDQTRKLATTLGFEKEFKKLNQLIGALLSTQSSQLLQSQLGKARAFGIPYDASRIELFESLFKTLKQKEFPYWPEKNLSQNSFEQFAFFESYFSNYIEGTIFELEEALEIIQSGKPLPARNQDSHDVLGTFRIVADKQEMSLIPRSSEELISILKDRHQTLLSARRDKNPGEFKDQNNFAGNTAFVDFKLVRGTLIKAFNYYQGLQHPFARAAFMMFLISEVHPFLDGNGRIARVMMNAELVKGNQSKIIIPTVYREDYLLALRRLTRKGDAAPYLSMLSRAHAFSAQIVGEDRLKMQLLLTQSNAFQEHTEAQLSIPNT